MYFLPSIFASDRREREHNPKNKTMVDSTSLEGDRASASRYKGVEVDLLLPAGGITRTRNAAWEDEVRGSRI